MKKDDSNLFTLAAELGLMAFIDSIEEKNPKHDAKDTEEPNRWVA